MSNRKFEMYEYRTIIYRLQLGESGRAIAKSKLAGRDKISEIKRIATAQGWLVPGTKLPDERLLKSIMEKPREATVLQSPKAQHYATEIDSCLKRNMSAKVIYQLLHREYAYDGSYERLLNFINKRKADIPSTLTLPLTFKMGEAAQVDFGKGPILYDERRKKKVSTWFFVMTLCWSRHQYAELIVHQDSETWLHCHQRAFEWFSGVPHKVIIDNAKCAIIKACYNDPQVQRSYEAFSQEYGFIISACPPYDPKKKGRVEAGVKYIKCNFIPLCQSTTLQGANRELKNWVLNTAGNRIHGTTQERPLSSFAQEQSTLKPLPIHTPEIATWHKVTLYQDCHVRFNKGRYSAPYQLHGQTLWLKATDTLVSIYHDHECKAVHPRLYNSTEPSTKLEHLPPKGKFYLKRDAKWCMRTSQFVGPSCAHIVESLLTDPVRDLLRQTQSLLNLEKKYGSARLEKACYRAVKFNSLTYVAVKTILQESLDNENLNDNESFDTLSTIYQGGAKYQRKINKLQH